MVLAQEELAGVPLSGLVVISDGADNSGETLAESLLPFQAAKVPVYTVGLGEETLSPDVQVSRVEVPRSVLKGTSLVVDVIISHRGYSDEPSPWWWRRRAAHGLRGGDPRRRRRAGGGTHPPRGLREWAASPPVPGTDSGRRARGSKQCP